MLTVFTTTWCPSCAILTHQLRRARIEHREVDIDADEVAAAVVARLNGGSRKVPTVVFADGSVLIEPDIARITARLAT